MFFLSVAWIFILFLLWDLKQLLLVGFSYSGNALGDYWTISSQATWLPLIAEISRGNLFPIDPFLGQGDVDFRFFPYLTLWFSGFLLSIFGVGGVLFISNSLLPTLSYIFMVLIYRCFLNWRWSISLSALGILGFNYDPFREFLVGLFLGESLLSIGADSLPGATGFPFPAISLLSFLIVFYFSIKRVYLSKSRSIILSIAWAIQSQIHIVNLIFGLPFWFCFFGFQIWRSAKNKWTYKELNQILFHIGIVSIICLPMILSIIYQFNNGLGFEYLAGSVEGPKSLDWFFIIAYCIIPLLVLRVAYGVFRVDPYELLIKFLPVWVAMLVELVLSLAWQIFSFGLPTELLSSRLGLFFLHIFYYTPAIYCMHRSNVNYSVGSESLRFSSKIRSFFIWLARDASLVFLPIIVILLTIFFTLSSEKNYLKSQDSDLLNIKQGELIQSIITSEMQPGDVLIGPNIVSNLLLPINERYGGIWINQIISNHNSTEVIERFATYAKLVGWTESEFHLFMMPGHEAFNKSKKAIDISSNNPISGFGYWLTYHNNVLNSNQLKELSLKVTKVYNSINLYQKLNEYNVKRVVVNKMLQDDIGIIPKKKDQYYVYDFR